jgi:hypothetical protein
VAGGSYLLGIKIGVFVTLDALMARDPLDSDVEVSEFFVKTLDD